MREALCLVVLAAGLSGCALDNSDRIERERMRSGLETRLAQAEDDLKRVQASCQDLERALNQERDARAALQQRLAMMDRPEPPRPVAAAKPAVAKPSVASPVAEEPAVERLSGEAAALSKIQAALAKAGYNPGPADGKMGHQTKQALMKFQKDNGLKPDGVLGPRTLDKLKEFLEPGAKP